jgi:hypothetical protein
MKFIGKNNQYVVMNRVSGGFSIDIRETIRRGISKYIPSKKAEAQAQMAFKQMKSLMKTGNVLAGSSTMAMQGESDFKTVDRHTFSIKGSEVSCGVYQMRDFPTDFFIRTLESVLGSHDAVVDAFRDGFTLLKEECKFVILSNNTYRTEFNDVLDSLVKVKTDYEVNPNSGNEIKVWVVDVNEK